MSGGADNMASPGPPRRQETSRKKQKGAKRNRGLEKGCGVYDEQVLEQNKV